MKKIVFLVFPFLLISCGEKPEILLPVANESVVSEVTEHTPVDFFFKLAETEETKDTLVEVSPIHSKKSPAFTFSIDKRLPLRKVILVIKTIQTQKEDPNYIGGDSERYFTYTDTIKKAVAFVPFTKIHYKLEKPDFNVVYFHLDRNDLVHYNELVFSKMQLEEFINKLPARSRISFSYDKGMSFGKYMQYRFFIKNLNITQKGVTINYNKEYIY